MINDIRFAKTKEQSLDAWVDETIAAVNDAIYEVIIQIVQVLSEVMRHVR